MASTVSLDHLTDSPQAGGYFKQMPSQSHLDGKPWASCSQSSSSTTLSLDLEVEHLRIRANSPLSIASHPDYHGSAPDLRSPESSPLLPHSTCRTNDAASTAAELLEEPVAAAEEIHTTVDEPQEQQQEQPENGTQAEASPAPPAEIADDPIFIDDGMDSVSARTEALAVCSTFKLRGRGRTPSAPQGNA